MKGRPLASMIEEVRAGGVKTGPEITPSSTIWGNRSDEPLGPYRL